MRRRWLAGAVLGLLMASPAAAQVAVPVHTNLAILGTGTGALNILPARVRSLLGLQNDHATAVIYCTVDGTDAAVNTGIRVNTAGGTVLFDAKVPNGALRCVADAASVRLLYQEGQ